MYTEDKRNLEDTLDHLEKSAQNTERLIELLTIISEERNGEKIYTEEDKRKAAYALNLCTVSVSQIIDYEDIIILEQEYELILNNLNLENMPKDEALLNILKQILDTITYFRIEKGDKALIDKEYEHRVKNAIWSAVPNFGLIVAGGHPVTIAVSLASQVGLGFMNYRRNKAEYRLDKEKSYWQLQRTAIEQLNGLRRELFDAAWRLADEYNFPDEYRLTEKQIASYNAILEDRDPVRRFERLDAIKDKFQAYAPFWYFLGNTLLQIAEQLPTVENRKKIYSRAKACYEQYFDINQMQLLREDQIAASCALEYAGMLDAAKEVQEIDSLIQIAERNSGDAFDILQLCAMQYLGIGNYSRAKALLRRLVNEDYNTILNAQLLSSIYVSDYVYSRDIENAQLDYALLTKRVDSQYLFKMPVNELVSAASINESFYKQQQEVLLKQYHDALNAYIRKYTIKFNKLFPLPKPVESYSEDYFLDDEIKRAKRMDSIKAYIATPSGKREFCDKLKDYFNPLDFLNLVEEMYNNLVHLDIMIDPKIAELRLTDSIVEQFKKKMMHTIESIHKGNIDDSALYDMINLSFRDIVYAFYKEVDDQLRDCIRACQNMSDISNATYKLYQFCRENEISLDDTGIKSKDALDEGQQKRIFSLNLLGEGYRERKKDEEITDKVRNLLDKYEADIARNNKVNVLRKGTMEFRAYFNKLKMDDLRKVAVAVVDAKNGSDVDLIITLEGVLNVKKKMQSEIIPFERLTFDAFNTIIEIEDKQSKESSALKMIGTASTLTAAGIAADVALGLINPIGVIAKNAIALGATAAIGAAKGVEKNLEGIIPFKYDNKNVNVNVLYSMICDLKKTIDGYEEKEDYGRSTYDFLNHPL